MSSSYGLDAYSPAEIAQRVHEACLLKARLSFLQLAMLGMLAGAFIGLGALYYVIVVSDLQLGFAMQRVLGGGSALVYYVIYRRPVNSRSTSGPDRTP
ncbi:MAG: hypothetical protein KDI87_08435 [Gammaproteobacteria bacterium]|nr:hypothetical protein [Gammaproteobacteria bacterium]MCP5140341.1 hypothetical protein [Chromatiales bacterium]